MVKDCNDIIRNLQDKDAFKYPQELLSLEGLRKIFQLHFAPVSTKENRVFFLDTTWNTTTLLTAGPSNVTQPVPEAMLPISSAEPLTEDTMVTNPNAENQSTATSSASLSPPASVKHDIKESLPGTPPEDTPNLPTESKAKYAPRKTSVHRTLYSDEEQSTGQDSHKKTRKNDS